jgi:hypothetical protein
MKLIRLSNKSDECWGHWPALRDAISEAAAQLGQRTVATGLDKVLAHFAYEGHAELPPDRQGTMAVWYVLDDDGKIVAHLLATEDRWDGEKVIYVNQGWGPNLRRDLRAMICEELDNYARSRECRKILMYTRRHAPRFWKAVFGFEPRRVLYRRTVP